VAPGDRAAGWPIGLGVKKCEPGRKEEWTKLWYAYRGQWRSDERGKRGASAKERRKKLILEAKCGWGVSFLEKMRAVEAKDGVGRNKRGAKLKEKGPQEEKCGGARGCMRTLKGCTLFGEPPLRLVRIRRTKITALLGALGLQEEGGKGVLQETRGEGKSQSSF